MPPSTPSPPPHKPQPQTGQDQPPLNLFPTPSLALLPCRDNNGFVSTIPALQVAHYCVVPVLTQQVQAPLSAAIPPAVSTHP